MIGRWQFASVGTFDPRLLGWQRSWRGPEAWAEFLEAHQEMHRGAPAGGPVRPRQFPMLAISLSPRLLARAPAPEIQSVVDELAAAAAAVEFHLGRLIWN